MGGLGPGVFGILQVPFQTAIPGIQTTHQLTISCDETFIMGT